RLDFTVRDTDGDTASSSVAVNVAPPETVELSNNGIPYQASNDPENINGSVGNDTVQGGAGADYIYGGSGDDVLLGNAGNDVLYGDTGNDRIQGGLGVDRIQGGAGNDTLTGDIAGSPFADVFAWSLSDQGTVGSGRAVDTITDFSTAARAAGGDVLDLRDLLQGENTNGGVGNLVRYLDIDTSGADTVIRVSSTGNFSSNGTYASGSEDQRIVLTGVNLRTDMGLSTNAGDQQVIQELLNRGKLLVDNS
ncbi:MAG: type I secretion C-terminal target domain-containing protein, partial [Aquabacterium sp.]|nr:type I secretion C-terminal target domain-containing protein [Aquabacterium sp.]